MRALVTGATGTIGPKLVGYLLSNGFDVRVVSRNIAVTPHPGNPVEIKQCDIRDAKTIAPLVRHADVVFHLAAKLHINNPSQQIRDEYDAINVDGTANVARAAAEHHVKRFVHFSTINVYGPSDYREPFDEQSPLNPIGVYAQSKIKAEKAVRDIFKGQTSSSYVILRLAAVYGPRMQGNYKTLVKAMKYNCFWPIGSGFNRRTLIYIDDLVRGAVLASAHTRAGGETYNLTDGGIHTLNDIIDAIALALGRKTPRGHVPKAPAFALATMVDKAFATMGKPHISLKRLLEKLIEDVAVNGDKFQRDLDFHPQFSIEQGWQKSITP